MLCVCSVVIVCCLSVVNISQPFAKGKEVSLTNIYTPYLLHTAILPHACAVMPCMEWHVDGTCRIYV